MHGSPCLLINYIGMVNGNGQATGLHPTGQIRNGMEYGMEYGMPKHYQLSSFPLIYAYTVAHADTGVTFGYIHFFFNNNKKNTC